LGRDPGAFAFRSRIVFTETGAALSMRKIIHVDMDCFYAAVEERERPELRGRPVGVGGAREGRGVLTTCNYEARQYGVHSAMPTFQALAKCPHLLVVPPRFDLYRAESIRIRGIFADYTPLIEPLSLDEAYLDVSHLGRPATEIAREIRGRIFGLTALTASAGVAPNKMLAKIASDFRKPNGQHTVRPDAVEAFMHALPVRKIPGIGSVMAQRLGELGVETCGQLQAFAADDLARRFGKFGLVVYERCRGIDERPVEANRERKSLSNERTFNSNLVRLADCHARLEELFSDLCEELAAKNAAREITKIFVKLRFADFSRTTVERGGEEPDLEKYRELLAEGWQRREPARRSVRLLGVGVRFATSGESRDGRREFGARETDQLILAF
jgi:DNA polymerase-4